MISRNITNQIVERTYFARHLILPRRHLNTFLNQKLTLESVILQSALAISRRMDVKAEIKVLAVKTPKSCARGLPGPVSGGESSIQILLWIRENCEQRERTDLTLSPACRSVKMKSVATLRRILQPAADN